MEFGYWEQLPADHTRDQLVGTDLLFMRNDGSPDGLIVRVMPWDHGLSLRYTRTTNPTGWQTWKLPAEVGIVNWAADLLGTPFVTTIVLPPVAEGSRPIRGRFAIALAVLAVALVIGVAFPPAAPIALLLGAMAAGAVALFAQRPTAPAIMTPGDLELDCASVVDYARRRQLGERPEVVRAEARRAAIDQRVADIEDEYVALSSDIVYRIENSALFDSAVPTTERFRLAMLRWDDAGDVTLAERDALAAEVEIAWSVARDNAETLGALHLPTTARGPARRAAKAAALAAEAGTAEERNAAMGQVIRILDALALYYLPTVNRETLQLEPPSR